MNLGLLCGIAMTCAVAAAADSLTPLQPIDRSPLATETRCSEFFYSTTWGGATEEQVVYAHKTPDGKVKREVTPLSQIIVHPYENAPAYETTADGIVFWLNATDYANAANCHLPKSTPAPAPK